MLKSSLEDVLFRWVFYMTEAALHKLRPIIEILESQLILKNVFTRSVSHKWLLDIENPAKKLEKI